MIKGFKITNWDQLKIGSKVMLIRNIPLNDTRLNRIATVKRISPRGIYVDWYDFKLNNIDKDQPWTLLDSFQEIKTIKVQSLEYFQEGMVVLSVAMNSVIGYRLGKVSKVDKWVYVDWFDTDMFCNNGYSFGYAESIESVVENEV